MSVCKPQINNWNGRPRTQHGKTHASKLCSFTSLLVHVSKALNIAYHVCDKMERAPNSPDNEECDAYVQNNRTVLSESNDGCLVILSFDRKAKMWKLQIRDHVHHALSPLRNKENDSHSVLLTSSSVTPPPLNRQGKVAHPSLCLPALSWSIWSYLKLLPRSERCCWPFTSWLPDRGYQIVATKSWLPHLRCQILASRSWQQRFAFNLK